MTSRTLQIIGRVSPALCSTPVRTPPAEGGAAGHPSKPVAKEGASNDRREGPETSKRKRGASRRQGRSKHDRSDPSHSTMRAPRMSQNRREEEQGQKEIERRRMEEDNKIKPKKKIKSRPDASPSRPPGLSHFETRPAPRRRKMAARKPFQIRPDERGGQIKTSRALPQRRSTLHSSKIYRF